MFVVVSWLSFLVPPESVPGRMAICMTTLLTLTAMFAAVRQSTPSVSYVKALDIWMVVCIFFVFLTLVEYTLVLRYYNILFFFFSQFTIYKILCKLKCIYPNFK